MGDQTVDTTAIQKMVTDTIRTCYDPEVPVNIYELGLIYGVTVELTGMVRVRMTLTAPNCPAAQSLPEEVEEKVRAVPGVTDAAVEVTFDPPWTPDRMSEAAKLELGFM